MSESLEDVAKDVAVDVLDDGKLSAASRSRLKRAALALGVGVAAAALSAAATVLVTVPTDDGVDLPGLMESLRLAVVGGVVAYVRDKL